MTHLQMTMCGVWVVIILFILYSIGEAFDSGWELIGSVLAAILFYTGCGFLIYYTFKAVFG